MKAAITPAKVCQVLLTLTLICIASPALAKGGQGVGIGIGQGTGVLGLSLKAHKGPTAVQLVVGRWDGASDIGAEIDALAEFPTPLQTRLLGVDMNAGVGVAFGVGSPLQAAASPVLGLELNLVPVPIDIVIEYRPRLDIIPDIEFDPYGFGAHVRVYLF